MLGIDRSGFSPRVQHKIVHAGVNGVSYQQASRDLAALSDLEIKPKPIERLVTKIGQERAAQRDAAVAEDQRLPLMARDVIADPGRPCPAVAMVSMDGGRLQVRSDQPSSSHHAGHWRESKVAVLETYRSDVHQADPDPHLPRCFLDLKRTTEMVRGLGHALPLGLEFAGEGPAATGDDPTAKEPVSDDETAKREGERSSRPGRPERLVRSVLASRRCVDEFGPMVQQAAWHWNFFGEGRRAFLGDGLAANWKVQSRYFASFTPVLDFVHALSYVLAAAFAGRTQAEGIKVYKRWIEAVWAGRVATILAELEARSAELGLPPQDCVESDPRKSSPHAIRPGAVEVAGGIAARTRLESDVVGVEARPPNSILERS